MRGGSPRLVTLFVWGVWVAMLGGALFQITRYGHNIPFSEDWSVVPFVHGSEPMDYEWLWSQNNEHRLPLPRLLLIGLFRLTGDYRAGMFFNAGSLALLALAMIRTAEKLRGRLAWTDAFFPIAFLNWGEGENLGWSWQVGFVASSIAACLLLVLIARETSQRFPMRQAIVAGLCLVALPLTGGSGLIYVPALALWAVTGAWLLRRRGAVGSSTVLAGSVAVVSLVSVLYFVHYQHAYWNPPSPSVMATIRTTGAILALSFGPAARLFWGGFAAAGIGLLAGTLWLIYRKADDDRLRRTGMLLFGAALACMALAVGNGRAGLVKQYGLPIRYVLLSLPLLCWAYFAWELYFPRGRRFLHAGLLISMILLLPFNYRFGMQWTDYYAQGMNAFERDVRAGAPRFVVCNQYQNFLMHWDGKHLCYAMGLLQQARVGVFEGMTADPAAAEVPVESSSFGAPRRVYAIRVYFAEVPAAKGDWLDVSWSSPVPGGATGHRRILLDEINTSEQKSYLVWVNGAIDGFRIQSNRVPAMVHVAKTALVVPAKQH